MTASTDTAWRARASTTAEGEGVRAGTLAALRRSGQLLTKVGSLPVVVFADGDDVFAIEDRCPHMGFPLHRGTVDCGLVTCHWHHARFDLASGCTLDPFADDAQAFDVRVVDGDVFVAARPAIASVEHLDRRLIQGLEDGLTLVTAKAVLGLLEHGVAPRDIIASGIQWGTTYRERGWGSGLTVLVAMANVLPSLDEEDRAAALVHGLAFVSRDTCGSVPRFALDPLTSDVDPARLAEWYRRFVETRSGDAGERTLATAVVRGTGVTGAEAMMFAAVTDHVFIDGGHTIDFTNKAFESLAYVGDGAAASVLTTLVHETARASRDEETSEWRHPYDLAGLVRETEPRLIAASQTTSTRGGGLDDGDVALLGWSLLGDDAHDVVEALVGSTERGASAEQLGRAVAFAAALRLVRFHTQNDHADWNTVHHAFTAANALHQALLRQPTPELLRGVVHGALRVHLDRFLNVPPARMPVAGPAELAELDPWWDVQGGVNEAGTIAFGYLRNGGDPAALVARLGAALLREDVEFHWYQVFEAAVRQARAWPDGSEEQALVLTGLARFLAAHTPTRRELSRVIDLAARLRRGEALYEDLPDPAA